MHQISRGLRRLTLLFVLLAIVGLVSTPAAQQPAPANSLVDEEFARLVKEWTTKPEFITSLVDHLPKKPGVPTPKDILGYHIGAPKKLTYTADQQRFFRALEKALPGRVKTFVAGKSEEGRDILVAFVTSEANLKNLEVNRQNMRRLADPRGLSESDAAKLVATTKPHYHISAGLHSTETSPPETVIELAYRLAVSEEPYIRAIRDNVIVSIAPTTDLDGRDRAVDWYYAYKIDEAYDGGENYGGPPYWGKYVFHDNNRDINYGVDSLRAHLNWYLHWVPPIWHDLHEAQTLLYTFSGQPPQNANLDPILYTELPFFATYEVNKLTSLGMPGVWHFGFVDTWSPGYLGFAASNHNGMLRMYEIFNQGGANTKKARLQGPQLTREWYRPKPAPQGEVDWSIRNSVNYAQSGVLTALELASTFPKMIVENFYKKSVNSIRDGEIKAPYAFVIPAGQNDQTQMDRMVNLIRRQAIEVHRATAEVKTGKDTFAAGSYIVKLNQPYGRLAKTLLEKQTYPDANLRTYDDSAWTMGLASNVDVRTIDDKAILTAPATLLTEDVVTRGEVRTGVEGAASAAPSGGTKVPPSAILVKHNGSLNLITLRYRLKDLPIKALKSATKVTHGAGGAISEEEYPAGSLLIPATGAAYDRARKEIEALGLVATSFAFEPKLMPTSDVDLPRIAIYTTWANTEKVGWVRLAFDRWEIPFDLIHKDHVQTGANLRSKYDVIVMPHQTQSGKTIVYEQPKLSKPLAYKKNDKFKSLGMYAETDDVRGGMGIQGVAEFVKFIEQGGMLMTLGVASFFPAEFGLTRVVDAQRPQGTWYAPGPYVQSEILATEHPVVYGLNAKTLPVRWGDGPLLQVAGQGGPGGGPGGGGPGGGAPAPPPEPPSPDRATVIARFQGNDAGVLSGLMRGADQIRNRPMVVDSPVGKGRVLLFANNPIYRWQTFGEHGMVFNALLFFNDFPAAAAKPQPTTAGAEVPK